MNCEMINLVQSLFREQPLFAVEGRASVPPSAGFHQVAAAVTIIARITVLLRSG
jgi:hypothetical protein